MRNRILLTSLVIYFLSLASIKAQLSLSNIFTDHMVLQREQPILIWGEGNKGEEVTIKLNGFKESVDVNPYGKWSIELSPMDAGGPYELIVKQGSEVMHYQDIYIGDVWICSGQSNMEWTVALSDNAGQAVDEADDPLIRQFKVAHSYAEAPEEDLVPGEWKVAEPEIVSEFTAVGYYFAKELRNYTDVPIGLINTSWGGSRIEAWMSAESQGIKDVTDVINAFKEEQWSIYQQQTEQLRKQYPGLTDKDQGMIGADPAWASHRLDDTQWDIINTPGQWEGQGYDRFDGIGWYRIHVHLEDDLNREYVKISLAKVDDSDQVWINGNYIGGTQQAWDKTRLYNVAPEYLKQGDNVIAIRVEDTGGGGGIHGSSDNMYMNIDGEKINISGQAYFRPGALMTFRPVNNVHHTPTMLYNKMIYPLFKFPVKGVIWYQGESNAGSTEDAMAYADQFKRMIVDWRANWGVGEFPFLYVQLANFMQASDVPAESNWAELRESQGKALELENVGEAVIIDIGEADDIHPRNKKDVGHRLSLEARRIAYGENIVSHGPRPVSHQFTEGVTTITFDQDLILNDKNGYVKELDVESMDGQRYWAQGMADGNKLKVYHPEVKNIKSIRYGWSDNPDDVNLYNEEGLPASPFKIEILK